MASSVDYKAPKQHSESVRPINRWITPENAVEKSGQDGSGCREDMSGGIGVMNGACTPSEQEKPVFSVGGLSESGHPVTSSQKVPPSLSHHQRYVNGRNSPSSSSRLAEGAGAVSKQSERQVEVEADSGSSKISEHSSEDKGWIIEAPAGDLNNKNGWIQDNGNSKIETTVDISSSRRPSLASQAPAIHADIQVSDPRSGGKRMSLSEYIAETGHAPAKVDEHICKSCGSVVTKKPIYHSVSESGKEDIPALVSAPDSRRTSTSTASLAPSLPHGYIPTDMIYGWGPGVTASTPVSVAGDIDAALSSRKASTASIASSILYPKPLPSGAVTPEDLAYGWGPSSNTSFSKEDDLMELSLDMAKKKAALSPQASVVSDVTVKEAVSPTATTFSGDTLVDEYKPSKIIGWKDDNDDITTLNPSWNGWDLSSKMQQAHLSPKYTTNKGDEEPKHDVKKPSHRQQT